MTGLDQSGASPARRDDLHRRDERGHQGQPGAGGGAPPPDAFVNAPPCSTYFGEKTATQYPAVNGQKVPFAPCGYTPSQYQGAYGTAGLVAKGIDGRGVTVAITDAYAAPTILQDANTYARATASAPSARASSQQILPNKFRFGFDDPQRRPVRRAGLVRRGDARRRGRARDGAGRQRRSTSRGRSATTPTCSKALEHDRRRAPRRHHHQLVGRHRRGRARRRPAGLQQTFVQAALEGIGVFFSSGDDGDDSLDTADGSPAVDFPASHPLVTAVGGTRLAVGAEQRLPVRDRLGDRHEQPVGRRQRVGPALPGRLPVRRRRRRERALRRAVLPARRRSATRRPRPPRACPTSRWTAIRRRACSSARPRRSRTGACGTPSTASAARASPRRCTRASRRWPTRPPGTRTGSPTRRSTRWPAAGAARHTGREPGRRRSCASTTTTASTPRDGTTVLLRSLDDEAQSLHLTPGWDNLTGVGSPTDRGTCTRLEARALAVRPCRRAAHCAARRRVTRGARQPRRPGSAGAQARRRAASRAAYPRRSPSHRRRDGSAGPHGALSRLPGSPPILSAMSVTPTDIACSSSTTSRTSSTSSRWPCASRASRSSPPAPARRRSPRSRRSSPHLIVLDVMLPDMEGFDVAQRLGAAARARADHLPHRARRDRGQDPRADARRRRLRHQAVQPRGARRAHPHDPAPHRRSPSPSPAGSSFEDLELDEDAHEVTPRRRDRRADRDRVPPAALPDAQPAPRAHPRAAARARVGLRLRRRRARARDLRQLPAQEARRRTARR